MRCRSDNSFRTYLLVPKRTSSEGGDRFVIPCLNDANTTKSVSRHLSWETRPICFFWGFSSLLQFRRGRRFIVVVGRETISNKQTVKGCLGVTLPDFWSHTRYVLYYLKYATVLTIILKYLSLLFLRLKRFNARTHSPFDQSLLFYTTTWIVELCFQMAALFPKAGREPLQVSGVRHSLSGMANGMFLEEQEQPITIVARRLSDGRRHGIDGLTHSDKILVLLCNKVYGMAQYY
jgi:hypothetical protein